MLRPVLFGILSLYFLSTSSAQPVAVDTLRELFSAIKENRRDTGQVDLYLRIAYQYLSRRGEEKKDLDSANIYITRATQLSNQLGNRDWISRTRALAGEYHFEAGNVPAGKQDYLNTIGDYHRRGKMAMEAAGWSKLADLLINKGMYGYEDDRLAFYRKARLLYQKLGDKVNAATVLTKTAEIHLAATRFDVAEKELQQALAEYKSVGYRKLQDTFGLLYTLEFGRGNYYRAIAHASEGIKAMKASGDSSLASQLYHNMAHTNFIVKKYSVALHWIKRAVHANPEAYTYRCVLAQTLLELNKVEEAGKAIADLSKVTRPLTLPETLNKYRITGLYLDKTGKPEQAVKYHIKILELAKESAIGEHFYNIWSVICNNEIAGIFLRNNQASKAGKYVANAGLALKNAKTLLDPRYRVLYYGNVYKYNLSKGNYHAAIKGLEQRDRLEDSLFTADKDKQVAELNIQYEIAQKEQSIRDLHNQTAIQEARLETANLQRNITIGGIILMIIVSAVFYRNFKQKQQSNRIITQKNNLLQHLLAEKEWLLREVHHRVKNNLHTVICLLEAQARFLENDALRALETTQNRIYAMSLIHQKLYQSDDVKTIDMSVYVSELVRALEESFGLTSRIRFELNVQPISLAVSNAIPVGLIINEVVTNSIKHAFPDHRPGIISIQMFESGDNIILKMADDGIGMSLPDESVESESLGVRLIKGLSEDIDANIVFEVGNGTRITIVFKPDNLEDAEVLIKPQGKIDNAYGY